MVEPPAVELDADAILEILDRHEVQYVVIGGFAALLHGAPLVTVDIDITPASDHENLERLARALTELGSKLRASGVEDLLTIPLDARTFEQFPAVLNLRTDHGDLDITLQPSAPDGRTFSYDELAASAVEAHTPRRVIVASIDHIIASKRAAGRPKDLASLDLLEELRAQLRDPG